MTARSWRTQAYELLDGGESRWLPHTVARGFLVTTILASVAAIALETVEALAVRYHLLFTVIEHAAVLFLTIDYALRLWTAPEHDPALAGDPGRARRQYACAPIGVIDLLAVLPYYASLVVPIAPDWLRVLRLLRLLKLARYVPALSLFAAVIRNERRPLLAALMVLLVLLVLNAGVMYVLEHEVQPQAFASIPHAMWWAIVTMATVGYGDVFPVTPLGRLFGALVMILGIAMFAVPAGILATGFAVELRKRDFVVTWQTVARVPLFASLDAARIAEIARLLKRQIVPAKYVVVRRGEPADAMFFVMQGEVEVDIAAAAPRRMGRGEFFGEIALLRDTVRTATVTTLTECELLALEVADFRRLLDRNPGLRAAVTRVAEARLSSLGALPTGGPPAPPPPSQS